MPAYLKRPTIVQKRPLLDSTYRPLSVSHPFNYKPASNAAATHHFNTEKIAFPRLANAYETPQDLRIDYPLRVEPTHFHNRDWRRRSFSGLLVCLLFVGAFSLFITLRNNHQINVQAEKISAANKQSAIEANNSTAKLATTVPAAISTIAPTASSLASYTVAANQPRYLIIPELSVDARIFSVGLGSNGAIIAPNNINDTDWYKSSALPGQPGAMLIDGHVAGISAEGVFYRINSLAAGDIIEVERGDGMVFTYKVISSHIYNSGSLSRQAVLTPAVVGSPGLNLISSTNDIIPGAVKLNQQLVVYTEQINP
jgi:sortase (surface protein transpeptidase)